MKTFILGCLLALTAVSGVVAISNTAAAGGTNSGDIRPTRGGR